MFTNANIVAEEKLAQQMPANLKLVVDVLQESLQKHSMASINPMFGKLSKNVNR